jgi:hypothetical protein
LGFFNQLIRAESNDIIRDETLIALVAAAMPDDDETRNLINKWRLNNDDVQRKIAKLRELKNKLIERFTEQKDPDAELSARLTTAVFASDPEMMSEAIAIKYIYSGIEPLPDGKKVDVAENFITKQALARLNDLQRAALIVVLGEIILNSLCKEGAAESKSGVEPSGTIAKAAAEQLSRLSAQAQQEQSV